jgi:hypothetical protein
VDPDDGKKLTSVTLDTGESAFVAAEEIIDLKKNKNIVGRVVLKNSRIRQGLTLDAPVYQPGHHTRVFFRLTNVSGNRITLAAKEQYATILFEELTEEPGAPYEGAYSDEFDFSGMGKYKAIYSEQIQALEEKAEDIKSLERTIYANVLVILTVFVALFSFITTNFSLISNSAGIGQFLVYNLSLLGCIGFLVSLLDGIAGIKKRGPRIWLAAIIPFALALILFLVL